MSGLAAGPLSPAAYSPSNTVIGRAPPPGKWDKKAAHPLRQTGRGLKPGRRAWPGFDLSAPEACGKRMGPEG